MDDKNLGRWANADDHGFVTEWCCNAIAYLNLKLQAFVEFDEEEYQQAITTLENQLATLVVEVAISSAKQVQGAFEAKVKALDIKDNLLVIQGGGLTSSELNHIKVGLEHTGLKGIMLLPEDADVTVQALDDLILRLQGMKLKKQGIMMS